MYINISEVEYFEKQFEIALQEIDPTSTPGCCALSAYGSDNRTALGIVTDPVTGRKRFDPDRVELLRRLVKDKWDGQRADPLKVFVKQEPHKHAKLAEGRYRLITAVSLADTMVDRILFGPMWRKAMSRVLATPCAVGWSPIGGGWRLMNSIFREGTLSIDKSAWDWTVQRWMVEIWYDLILSLHPGHPAWWEKQVLVRFSALFARARYRFSDGVELVQPTCGIMKSGCYLTLCLNSVAQVALHLLVTYRLGKPMDENVPLAFGDDTVMNPFEWQEEYLEELNKFCVVKQAEMAPFVQFVGFVVTEKGFVPEYWQKHLFQLAHLSPEVACDTLKQYQMLYAYDPVMLRFIRNYASFICPSAILPDSELRQIVHY